VLQFDLSCDSVRGFYNADDKEFLSEIRESRYLLSKVLRIMP